MTQQGSTPATTPCLCNALRQASRAVSRLYDDELRAVGLRTTQYSLLALLQRSGEVRQGDLGTLTHLEETTLTRNLRPLVASGWIAIRAGVDRREKLVALTQAGIAKLKQAAPVWERAQQRLRSLVSEADWHDLLGVLPGVAQAAGEGWKSS